MKNTVLLVDDEADNIATLTRLFRKHFNIISATSGAEALSLLKKHAPAVIISDQRMPKMSGVEFLNQSIATHPESIRILLTGYTDIDSVISAINSGQIYKYVTKPWDSVDLLNTVEKAVEKFNLRHELKQKNIQLNTALDELKTLDEAKSNFMLLINHELKTPLTVISSYLQLLSEEDLQESQQKQLNKINQACLRLHSLINNSLELIEANSGQRKINSGKVRIHSLVSDILLQHNQTIASKSLKTELEIQVNEIPCDEKLLTSVLSKLIDNSLKFADKKTKVKITTQKQDDGVVVELINKGKKIDLSQIDKWLSPFTIDEKTLNHSKGTGLGLSICQALLNLIESQLKFNVNDNQTTVSFKLPL